MSDEKKFHLPQQKSLAGLKKSVAFDASRSLLSLVGLEDR